MKQATGLKDFVPDTLLPGIKINTSSTDFAPVEQLQMMQFKGGQWVMFGDIIQRRGRGLEASCHSGGREAPTRNLEIARCAIAHLGSGAAAPSRK